jgi:hypothetical protein
MLARRWMSTAAYNINSVTRTTAALSVKDAATVICLRRTPPARQGADLPTLFKRDLMPTEEEEEEEEDTDNRVSLLFGARDRREFTGGWEVIPLRPPPQSVNPAPTVAGRCSWVSQK